MVFYVNGTRKLGWFAVFSSVIVVIGWIIYLPGISGTFLLDDFANLPALGAYGPISSLENLKLYLTGGIGGPTGRPLALASFLLNARDWPADPEPFLVTNILLHLFNGILLGLLLASILRQYWKDIEDSRRANLVACAAALLWVLNPFLVSTTLYIVQRMTILSATFVLLGLIGYLHGRILLDRYPHRAYTWMTASIILGTFLAVLSKENGILLPLFCLILEWILFARHGSGRALDRRWKDIFLMIPSLLPLVYFLFRWSSLLHGYESRDFSIHERLATESVILFEYLFHLYIPHSHTDGLFHDSHPIYSFRDWQAVLAASGLLFIVGYSICARKRHKLLSIAILVYFGGHLLESTVVPLELYFEHRNYMPSVFLFLPLSIYVLKRVDTKKWAVVMFSLLVLYAYFTHQRAMLWGQPVRLVLTWAGENPDSTRAQVVAADELLRLGGYGVALSQLDRVLQKHPNNITLQLRRLLLKINGGTYRKSDLNEISKILEKTKWDFRAFELMESFVTGVKSGKSERFTVDEALKLFGFLSNNPSAGSGTGPDHLLQHVRGELFLLKGDRNAALEAFLASLSSRPVAGAGMQQAAVLASNGAYKEALLMLDKVESILEKNASNNTIKDDYLEGEAKRMRRLIMEDMKEASVSMDKDTSKKALTR